MPSFERSHADCRRAQRGALTSSFAVYLVVIALLILVIVVVLTWGKSGASATRNGQTTRSSIRYACAVTSNGVPQKVVIANWDGAQLFSEPRTSSRSVRVLPRRSTWFVFKETPKWIRIGSSSTSNRTEGWVRSADVLKWMTREGLLPNLNDHEREPLLLFRDLADAGDPSKWNYKERTIQKHHYYPILDQRGGHYLIAVPSRKSDDSNRGVIAAWTGRLQVPQDAQIYYYTTRDELAQSIEDTRVALLELAGGASTEVSLVRYLRSIAGLTIGPGLDKENDSLPFWIKALQELRSPLSVTREQPSDIQRKTAVYNERLQKMIRFHRDPTNWSERGDGWLPKSLAPVD
jgi:hypothetical protein